MKKAVFMMVALWMAIVTYAQNPTDEERWYDGFLVTTSQDTIRGELSYNMVTNMVKVRQEDRMRVFTSFQTFHYKLYDEPARRWRKFYSVAFPLKTNHETPILFELLAEGKLSLMARERWCHSRKNIKLEENGYIRKDYYFIDRAGAIAHPRRSRSGLLALMEDRKSDLTVFIRDNHLDLSNERDLRILTTHYNKISIDPGIDREKDPGLTLTSPPSDLILGAFNEASQTWIRTDL
ncbi:MAG: hypothetical protein AAGA85_05815 [Bacteroidota bacterium]